jgi:hypothetical protein
MARAPSPPADAPNPTRTFIGEGTRTTSRPVRNVSRGEPGDLMYEAMPAEVDLHDLIGPYRSERTGRPPPDPVGGYGTDEYAPGFIAGQRFPTHNITPGNRVFDLGNRIPSDWIPYRGSAPDSVRDEGTPDQLWSTNFDPREAGMWTPGDLQMLGEQQLARNDRFNNPGIGFFGPRPTRFIPMRRGGRPRLNLARLRTLMRMFGGRI